MWTKILLKLTIENINAKYYYINMSENKEVLKEVLVFKYSFIKFKIPDRQ